MLDKLFEKAVKERSEANNEMLQALYGEGSENLSPYARDSFTNRVRDLNAVVRWLRKEMKDA